MYLDGFIRQRPTRVTDAYNPDAAVDDWTTPAELPLEGYFEPNSSTDVQDPVRRQTLTVYTLVIADPHADVKRGDRIVQGDSTWTVQGFPTAPKNPFTGWQPYLYVRVFEGVG